MLEVDSVANLMREFLRALHSHWALPTIRRKESMAA